MRSGNPSLKEDTFTKVPFDTNDNRMTLEGTINKSFLLLFIVVMSAYISWNLLPSNSEYVIVTGAIIIGFIISLICVFNPHTSPLLGPIYALVEGIFLGSISKSYNVMYDGIVLQAVLLTVAIFFGLLFLYKTKLIQATENFKLMVVSATVGIGIVYFITFLLSLFDVHIPYIHDSGTVGILISLFVVTIAAFNLVLDFDFIENGVAHGSPKYMEWYGAFGLTVTLVWLYLEILRLLGKLRNRD